MNSKLKCVGVDYLSLDYTPFFNLGIDLNQCILTNPSSNNDFLISPMNLKETFLATEVNYILGIDDVLKNHLKHLKKEKYDLLLMNGELDFCYLDSAISELTNKVNIVEFGISKPKSVEKFKKDVDYLRAVGINISYVLLDINPLFFQKDIIDYCNSEGITICGTNSFGGWVNSARLISTYTVPYLLNFSACYADIIFLSCRDMVSTYNNIKYLKNLIVSDDKEPFKFDDVNYKVESNIDELSSVSPVEKKKFTALSINGMILPYDTSELTFNPKELKISSNRILPQVKESKEKSEIELKVEELISLVYKDSDFDNNDYFTAVRYKIEDFLEISYPNWEKTLIKLTDKIMFFKYDNKVKKRTWYGKTYDTTLDSKVYLLYFSNGLLGFTEIVD